MPEIEPLSKNEQETVLKVALEMGDIKIHEKSINAYALVVFFLDTGAHPCVLAEKDKRELKVTEEGGKLFISWRRPKKKGKAAFTMLPVSKRLEPLIKDFLAQELPTYRKFYNDALCAVREKCLERYIDVPNWIENICPLGFRHTFGVNRIDDGFSETKVQQLMNCSAKTLKTYVRYSKTRLTEKGW